MWTRAELKDRAKAVLRSNYWQALLVSIIIALVGGGNRGSGGSAGRDAGGISGNNPEIYQILIVIGIVFILFRIFVGYQLEVGGRKYFVKSAQGDINFNYVGFSFKNGYTNVLWTMLYKAILIFLWTLLLIIPGIVKSYAYRMVPYILADNPQIDYNRAIELSNQMTMGEKFNIFVLDLSFIGWYILGMLALIIGVIFVMPYEDAANAELYLVLRKKALDSGLCTYEELNLSSQDNYSF
ncbi:Uncharacterized membrane protein [Caloramator quimbayensis]|uniref:Uncharacterized membrane protein n=1 Tax=Caloramator quimbayensis TaxID=1147123 RepID=A0A1T4XTN3_9CLOT|nr:DUF975 family protein [Caloramator quimbayensis]SKA92929.1 Uncharacterized membrane protein [Caloramator quimbayensis]